jgi:hypothetical protein
MEITNPNSSFEVKTQALFSELASLFLIPDGFLNSLGFSKS